MNALNLFRTLVPSIYSVTRRFPFNQKLIFGTFRLFATTSSQNGILRQILITLRSAWYRKPPHLVGTDDAGNRYFEAPPNKGSEHFNKSNLPRRFVLAPNQRNIEEPWLQMQGDIPSIPPEWASWLRHRRTDPPTNAEILANEEAAQRRSAMGAKIEAQRESERREMINQGLLHDTKSTVSGFKQKVAFPVYEDMETIPGEGSINLKSSNNPEPKT